MDFNPSIDPNKMSIGLVINIPPVAKANVMTEGMYVMQEGDNKEKISQLFGVTHLDLNNWNPDFDKKVVGDIILVKPPSKGTELEGVRTKGANVTVDNKPNTLLKTQWWETTDGKHIVKANESIAMLSAAYGFTEEIQTNERPKSKRKNQRRSNINNPCVPCSSKSNRKLLKNSSRKYKNGKRRGT